MGEADISIIPVAAILESTKKGRGMVKEVNTQYIKTGSMKEDGRMIDITDREHTIIQMETSIQAYGMISKGKEIFTTQKGRSIRDNGIICVVSRDMD